MFGKSKAPQKSLGTTVLVLDIESGSVAAALVHLPAQGAPKVLVHRRMHLPLNPTRNSADIAKSLEKTLLESLSYISQVAARMRTSPAARHFGTVGSAVVFFAAPWGTPNLAAGKAAFVPGMREFTGNEIRAVFGGIKVSFYTAADAVAYGTKAVGKHQNTLVTSMRGELLELLLLNDNGPQAYSTVPLGSCSILRTLKTHGALTEHEARSLLMLSHAHDRLHYEPMVAAAYHLSDSFADGAALLLPEGTAAGILVVAEHPLGEWFAKNLAENPRVAGMFSEEATTEAFLPHHTGTQLEPTPVNDPFILLETLFVENKVQ